MEVAERRFFVGQLVFAKLKGWPPWPGVIVEIDRFKAKISYFNWRNQYNWIGFKKLTLVTSAREIIDKHYMRNVTFRGAVDEMNRLSAFISEQRKDRIERTSLNSDKIPIQLTVNILLILSRNILLISFALYHFLKKKQIFIRLQRLTKEEIATIQASLKKPKRNLRSRK